MSKIDAILEFWFEGIDDTSLLDTKTMPCKKWFKQDPVFDEEIRRNFETDLLAAGAGERQEWEHFPRGILALIILYDQFSRNIYRHQDRMYAYDAKALSLTMRILEEKQEKEFSLIERAFIYLPLMHSEEMNLQKLSLGKYKHLLEESKSVNPLNRGYYEYTLKYAQEHHDTICGHGRFPYRDKIFNRTVG